MKETEVKVKSSANEHVLVAKQLVKLGFKKVKTVNEVNTLYEHPKILLKDAGNVLRVRYADRITLTYKGKQEESMQGFKVREEYEVEFSKGKEIGNILNALGFVPDLVIKKKRTAYRKGPVEVDLDSLPQLGEFIEIEGNEKQILSLLKKLKLDRKERITKGYAQLLREAKQ